jgi:hypothetical protein
MLFYFVKMDAFIEGHEQTFFHKVLYPLVKDHDVLNLIKNFVEKDLDWEDRLLSFRTAILAVHFANPRFLMFTKRDILVRWFDDICDNFKFALRQEILKKYAKENVLRLVINRSIQ